MNSTTKDEAYCDKIADLFALRLLQGEKPIDCFKDCLATHLGEVDSSTRRMFARACGRRIGTAKEQADFARAMSAEFARRSFEKRMVEKVETPPPVAEPKKRSWWLRIIPGIKEGQH